MSSCLTHYGVRFHGGFVSDHQRDRDAAVQDMVAALGKGATAELVSREVTDWVRTDWQPQPLLTPECRGASVGALISALKLIDERGCACSKTVRCWDRVPKLDARYQAHSWCMPCVAADALRTVNR